ncbi:MAG: VWA domain-containing protein [Clostridia bacterium]|nr:VWA domain-containing protein [Clostridia bacterium]
MNVLQEQQQQELEKYNICTEILMNTRNELYLSMRFFDVALSSLSFLPDGSTGSWGCDGSIFHFHPEYLLERYRENPVIVDRGFLHQLIHCLFGHLWTGNGKNAADWDLACDIAAEYLIDHLRVRCVHLPPSPLRREWYRRWEQKMQVLSAQKIYQQLEDMDPSAPEYRRMVDEFRRDDHQFWRKPPENQKQQNRQKDWDDIRDKMQTEIEVFSKEESDEPGKLTEALQVENREKYDYREFLRKFSVLKEEMQVDMDTFDYIFYNYGMNLYGNMPLIEPLETREVQKVEDFVIVIDTSMSCKGELVQKFLEQTYQILSQAESFFRRINIRILQCDEKVQDDVKIENGNQLKEYMDYLEIKGQGGTDFRPAFLYVQELMAKKAFHKLKGLLYFTDGYGKYPVKMPPYDVAFVFLEQDYKDVDVPPWAMKLILTEDEILYEH